MALKNNFPYVPSFLKASLQDTRPFQLTFSELVGTNIRSTSSFKYEPLNYPLKSTQQLNTDWSKFENHTFFSSAEVKVNVAFDQIINGYPFDGTKAEVEAFLENLSGFEKWVFDQMPTFSGKLHFSGTQVGEDPFNGYLEGLGTWIDVKDSAGWLFPDISKKDTGESIINPPENKSFTIEAQVFLPDQVNDRQVVLQKQSDDKSEGFTFHIEPSAGSIVKGVFSIISGGVNNFVQADLQKGSVNHVCLSLNRETSENYLQFFVNEQLASQSAQKKNIGKFENKASLYIGSGSSFYITGALTSPSQTFSGSLDELRIFNTARSTRQQQLYAKKGIYASEALKLYYRFNEPPVPLSADPLDAVNSIVLDSSGNSLHGIIMNFTESLRLSAADDSLNPMTAERSEFQKVLFPRHPDLISLNSELLSSASNYDAANPNLITKLIPRHYLRVGALNEGFANNAIEGTIGNGYGGDGIPGQGQLGSTQVMLTFLYIWAKFFDEIKMFVDAFKTLRTVDYKIEETIPSNFLQDFISSYGFYLPPFFNSSNLQQYVEGEDINEVGLSNYALKDVQSKILRRILVNMPDILKSKGTQHSIKSFIRAVGIDPDNSLRIREFGGPTLKQFAASKELHVEPAAMMSFHTSSLAITPYLSSSRIEPGYPSIEGTFIKGESNSRNDGLFTSGSWTFEATYKFSPEYSEKVQSLMRLETTGSSVSAQRGLLANVVCSGSLFAFIRPGMNSSAPALQLTLPIDILNGEKWCISFGCERNDSLQSVVSSSYFLRAATQSAGEIHTLYTTSSFFQEDPLSAGNAFRKINSMYNASGSLLSIGNDLNIPYGGMGYIFLNSTLDVSDAARISNFDGKIGNVRFWSKALSEKEWKSHVKNYKSLGVKNPKENYNYVDALSGSFEKLRLSTMEKQSEKFANSSGEIIFIDFSENEMHMTGTGFPESQRIAQGELFDRSYISPYFDEYSTTEKVRPRGVINEQLLDDMPWAMTGPVFDISPGEVPLDDPRLSIEFSLIDSLNKDIINMFATLDEMETAIGRPELAYSPDYPDLEILRDVYFNRLKQKLNFRNFFEFYRWFDLSMSTFIEQLVPRKTRFKGTNFVVESHMLERHKIEYQSSEIYLGDSTRGRIKDTLLSQQVVGKISKY